MTSSFRCENQDRIQRRLLLKHCASVLLPGFTGRIILAVAVALSFWTALQGGLTFISPDGRLVHVGIESVVAAGENLSGTAASTRSAVVAVSEQSAVATPVRVTTGFTVTDSLSQTIRLDLAEAIPSSDSITSTSALTTPAGIAVNESVTGTAAMDATSAQDETLLPSQDGYVVTGDIDGTILANRTVATAKFFVEGQTYTLPSLRSIGLDLPRDSVVLNLFNCDAGASEDDEACFWDPYMVDRDGIYEIVPGLDAGRAVNLLLQETTGPAGADVWIQNRSAKLEVVVYRNEVYELQSGAIREFSIGDDELPTFFLRSCIELDGASACEWTPAVVQPGVFYTLGEVETVGGIPNSRVVMLELTPASGAEDNDEMTQIAIKQIRCTLLVPALNVRSGPALEYQIVAKIRGSETAAATVLIVGRDATAEWLAVDERVAAGGWITGSANYVACEGSIFDLDEMEVTDGRLAPTPAPQEVAVAAAPETPVEGEPVEGEPVDGGETEAELTPTPIAEIPEGQSLLIINNGFDQDIRFTLDQKYRSQVGSSEYDLKPGDSTSILVFPGMVGFSASTPWRGLSDNDDFYIEEDESRTMWLTFVPDPDGSGEWLLQY